MRDIERILIESTKPPVPRRKDMRIGAIGAGFIMADCHLEAYKNAGLNPVAIASRTEANARRVAQRHGIGTVYPTWRELVRDETIEILDVAFPPDLQLEIVREAVKNPSIKGILCQKPLAMSLDNARAIERAGRENGVKIAVNSNMRYDQSMRALKRLITEGLLGENVLFTIEMRAIPHWQDFLAGYDKLEIFGMGIHHVDIFRYLYGDPEKVTALARTDPRTKFRHTDGITQYTFQYSNGFMATSLDDVWAWPNEPCEKDIYIKFRAEGTRGMADGYIGWPGYPARTPSRLRFTSSLCPGGWIEPKWDAVWFPDAFEGTMTSLMVAVENDAQPEISASDNLTTIGCVEALYQSIAREKTIYLKEIMERKDGIK